MIKTNCKMFQGPAGPRGERGREGAQGSPGLRGIQVRKTYEVRVISSDINICFYLGLDGVAGSPGSPVC